MSPSGIIQKPNIGKKPNMPPITRNTPSTMRIRGWEGTLTCQFPSLICLLNLSPPFSSPTRSCHGRTWTMQPRWGGKEAKTRDLGWQPQNELAICGIGGCPLLRPMFPGSSVVEQSAVNRSVAGSSPARGATFHHLQTFSAPTGSAQATALSFNSASLPRSWTILSSSKSVPARSVQYR